MLRKHLSLLTLFLCGLTLWAQRNVAWQDRTSRISLVSPGAVRLEYAPDGRFTDAPSYLAVSREYPAVKFVCHKRAGWVEIRTDKFLLRYRPDGRPFSAQNLSIRSAKGASVPFLWTPGQNDTLNLLGTYRTLDGYDGNIKDGRPMPLEQGLLSRSGWTCLDDSRGYVFDESPWPWVQQRPSAPGAQDWYFLAYGHDYLTALSDYTRFAGHVPLPPRYAFGYWWSRYWSYSDHSLRALVDKFERYDIPLDVLVIDMDWHHTAPGLGGWTGYTWNRRLFPQPDSLLSHLHTKDLRVTLNLHPAGNIEPYEEKYADMARWMGLAPDSREPIPYVGSDKRFMTGWLNTILRPLERQGVDFWWLDWQQGQYDARLDSLDNVAWINYVFFSDRERTSTRRPLLYHRWGGLGNHRYQIGFSGDSYISWRSLDFQPYFNSTASNVLYGFWSHDIGGHMRTWRADRKSNGQTLDPELYVRWMQFGALSPILRTHSTKSPDINKEPWNFSDTVLDILRHTILRRYALVPYIYTMARQTHDRGLSLCRPLYYHHPEAPEAYTFSNEYYFGDHLLVHPVTAPMQDGLATQTIWLPEGADWYEADTGTLLHGGQTLTRSFDLSETPLYVRAGTILPTYTRARRLNRPDEPLTLEVYPGGSGTFTLYEDHGDDACYDSLFATTLLTSERTDTLLRVSIAPRQGYYPDMPAERTLSLHVLASAVPTSVLVDGEPCPWRYDGTDLSLHLTLPRRPLSTARTVVIRYPADSPVLTDGTIGRMRYVRDLAERLRHYDAYTILGPELGPMASLAETLTYEPDSLPTLIPFFKSAYARLPQLLQAQDIPAADADSLLRPCR